MYLNTFLLKENLRLYNDPQHSQKKKKKKPAWQS